MNNLILKFMLGTLAISVVFVIFEWIIKDNKYINGKKKSIETKDTSETEEIKKAS